MESRKINIFAFIMIMVMCCFSIYFGATKNTGTTVSSGDDGLSLYELAVKNNLFSGTEAEFVLSQMNNGGSTDGSSVSVSALYDEYLEVTGKEKSAETYKEFLEKYYPESAKSVEEVTNTALRSTVDICYAFFDKNETGDARAVIPVYSTDEGKYYIDETKVGKYATINVSGGSGVIYQMTEDTAYIITNYHVVYNASYTNDPAYCVYYDETKSCYFTATFEDSFVKTGTVFDSSTMKFSAARYIDSEDIEMAPLYTHFQTSYGVYVYGYQDTKYKIDATFVGGSADNDIAVLKVEKDSSENNKILFNGSYVQAEVADSSKIAEGDSVVAVGNPMLLFKAELEKNYGYKEYVDSIEKAYVDSFCLTSTSGEVSLVSENCSMSSFLDSSKSIDIRLIRVSSAVNPGNSGGGLFDENGKLVGIVNGKIESASYDNIGFAIPANTAIRLADQIILQCKKKENTKIAVVSSKSIGISLKEGNYSTYFDTSLKQWQRSENVLISVIDSSNLVYAKNSSDKIEEFKSNDIIKKISFETDGKKYEYQVNHIYDVDEILLAIPKTVFNVTFVVSRNNSGLNQNEKIEICVETNAVNFTEIN